MTKWSQSRPSASTKPTEPGRYGRGQPLVVGHRRRRWNGDRGRAFDRGAARYPLAEPRQPVETIGRFRGRDGGVGGAATRARAGGQQAAVAPVWAALEISPPSARGRLACLALAAPGQGRLTHSASPASSLR